MYVTLSSFHVDAIQRSHEAMCSTRIRLFIVQTVCYEVALPNPFVPMSHSAFGTANTLLRAREQDGR